MSATSNDQTAVGDGFVEVIVKATGRRQWVPPHYLDDETLSAPFERIPDDEQGEQPDPDERPSTSWNNARIEAWAVDHEIDLADATTKAEMLAAIDAALTSGSVVIN